MNDNAKKWVEALRSGEYDQGKRKLSQNGLYCCLGVACDVYQKEVGDLEVTSFTTINDSIALRFDEEANYLPYKVLEWLGLDHPGGEWKGKGKENLYPSLTDENDRGASFEKIASIIESEPKGLFRATD